MPAREVRQLSAFTRQPGPPPQTAAPVSISVEIPGDIVLEIDPAFGRRCHQVATQKLAKGLPLTEREAEALAEGTLNHRELMRWLVAGMTPGTIPVTLNFPQGIV